MLNTEARVVFIPPKRIPSRGRRKGGQMKICFKISTLLHVMEDTVLNHRKIKQNKNQKKPLQISDLSVKTSLINSLNGNTPFCINKY